MLDVPLSCCLVLSELTQSSMSTCFSSARLFLLFAVALVVLTPASHAQLSPIGSYRSAIFGEGAAEITAYDAQSQRLFFVNAFSQTVDVLDVRNPANPSFLFSIDISRFGDQANSVAAHNGLVAIAVQNNDAQARGRVVFVNADGDVRGMVTVGALPDMVAFTPDGKHVVVANEGEPNDEYDVDPEGSISIITLPELNDPVAGIGRPVLRHQTLTTSTVRTATFTAFSENTLDPSVRIFGPGATVAQDLEPEYVAISPDGSTAWVSLQENNALAVVDIARATITDIVGLGFKDHRLAENALDVSNRDDAINITTWPVYGMYQPDAIATFIAGEETYIISANEGDSRDYDGFSEEERVGDLLLDASAFPDAATLQLDENLGRLKVTSTRGDIDGDGDYDELYAFGARSFSIWNADGTLVYDSGSDLEQLIAAEEPDNFNATDDENDSFDDRSDDKGPEPEGVVVGVVDGRTFAFLGLERVGGILVVEVTNPANPTILQYVNSRIFSGEPEDDMAGNLSPEGLLFIDAADSPTQAPLLVVSYEVSGSVEIFEFATPPGTYASKQSISSTSSVQLAGYPNPFNPTTRVSFHLATAQTIRAAIYDALGREVALLGTGPHAAGTHTATFDASHLPSGMYFVRVQSPSEVQVLPLTLLK